MIKTKLLFGIIISIIAGVLIAVIVMAFTGPGSNQPPTGDPVFWRKSGSNVYYNVSGGNVGIGMTEPDAKLKVYNENIGPVSGLLYVHDVANPTPNTNPGIVLTYGGSGDAMLVQSQVGARWFTIKDGNVGIGTTAPNAKFEVKQGAGNAVRIGHTEAGTWPTALLSVYNMDQGNGYNMLDVGTNLGKSLVARNDGRVGIGTLNSATGNYLCYGYEGGSWGVNWIGTCSSSKKYKEDFIPLKVDKDKIFSLQPVNFKWKDKGDIKGQRDIGLIAEEVNSIIPELTTYNEKGEILGVKYDKITLYILDIVKQQNKQIEELRVENDLLKSRIEKLESK